jgi:tRNA (guanine37-N1)-methyltransferase
MKIDILTAFPQMFSGPFNFSILRRAQDKSLVQYNVHDLRKWTTDNYKSVDDRPYGGGPGMVMRIDIIDKAVTEYRTPNTKVILLDAGGEKFNQKKASELSKEKHLIFICGHYEGVDHRVHEYLADEVISIGDYVLSGGEIPAMVIVDSVVRLLPGVLGNPDSLNEESHTDHSAEYPQYTRPEEYNGWKVPEVLLGGNHKLINEWRKNSQKS